MNLYNHIGAFQRTLHPTHSENGAVSGVNAGIGGTEGSHFFYNPFGHAQDKLTIDYTYGMNS
jgi:hypothetical protein